MFMKTLTSLLIALSLGSGLGLGCIGDAVAQQKLLPAQSTITFVSKQMGSPVEGKFNKFEAQVAFDRAKPEQAQIQFGIDLASVSVGGAETEAEIAKTEWFNTKAFPQATFASTQVRPVGPNQFEVIGSLVIKGQRRDIKVPVVLTQTPAHTVATGGFTLNRLDFKLGDAEWKDTSLVANEVQVKFKLALTGLATTP
jgi:polyisoprenoid-binding protein YceI